MLALAARATGQRYFKLHECLQIFFLASRFDQRAQRQKRRRIGNAVHPRLAEMTLEGGDDIAGGLVILARLSNAVTIAGEDTLEPRDGVTVIADHEHGTIDIQRSFAHPVTDAGLVKQTPR